jgi:hypothetical protein
LLNTTLADRLQDFLKGFIEGFFLLGDLEDGIKDNIIIVTDGIKVSFENQSI